MQAPYPDIVFADAVTNRSRETEGSTGNRTLTERRAEELELSEGRVLAPKAEGEDKRLRVTEDGSVAARIRVYLKTRDKIVGTNGFVDCLLRQPSVPVDQSATSFPIVFPIPLTLEPCALSARYYYGGLGILMVGHVHTLGGTWL